MVFGVDVSVRVRKVHEWERTVLLLLMSVELPVFFGRVLWLQRPRMVLLFTFPKVNAFLYKYNHDLATKTPKVNAPFLIQKQMVLPVHSIGIL